MLHVSVGQTILKHLKIRDFKPQNKMCIYIYIYICMFIKYVRSYELYRTL